MTKRDKISTLPGEKTKNGFSSNERFEMVIGGGHPDERSNQEWIKLMKDKGFKNIDKDGNRAH